MRTNLLLLFILLGVNAIMAQNNTVSSGGTASGSNGSATYSTGQVFYQTFAGTNGVLNQGVQQPYEISVLGNNNFEQIQLQIKVFPNPTVSSVYLKINEIPMDNLSYLLLDVQGKQIDKDIIISEETKIDMELLPAATYFLKIGSENNVLKTFKIIKK